MIETDVAFDAADGWTLHGTLRTDDEDTGEAPTVLISSAAAVPQTYYANFARALVEAGAKAVLTYDYRGIAASRGNPDNWRKLSMTDWALLDFPAAATLLRESKPGAPMVGLGHSFGGQALGLSGVDGEFTRYATIATMSGYWRGLDTPWSVWFQTQVFGRAVASILGHVPEAVSPGTTMPGGVFLDWARWINSPDYFFSDPRLPQTERFAQVTLPFLSIGLTDDPWGTRRAVDNFMERYTNADLRQIWIEPGHTGKIGHLGYFSRRHSQVLWPELMDFLLRGLWPERAEANRRAA